MSVTIHINKNFRNADFSVNNIKKFVNVVCKRFHIVNAIIDIDIVGNRRTGLLNKKFLGRLRTTDCISFDLSDNYKGSPRIYQLVINAEKALREAQIRAIPPEAEIALYIVHSLLHNIGFDDHNKREAGKMHKQEDKILAQSGYGKVYNTKTVKEKIHKKC